MPVNNEMYDSMGGSWWDEGEPSFATIRFFVNPVRFRYFKGIMDAGQLRNYKDISLLDVGCGGGFLAEEFAKTGVSVTGVDPSEVTIATARKHAIQENLKIRYVQGFGEHLAFPDGHFDIVCCCDALEHVEDLDKVISEISRVLKRGGIFFYDTMNRTLISKIVSIKAMQEWKSTAFAAPHAHDWDKFIKPGELFAMMKLHGLENVVVRGITPGNNAVANYLNLRKAVKKQITYKELGERFKFHISSDLMNLYIGYAVKKLK